MQTEKYDEILDNMKKDLMEVVDGVAYALELDSAADQEEIGKAVAVLVNAINHME